MRKRKGQLLGLLATAVFGVGGMGWAMDMSAGDGVHIISAGGDSTTGLSLINNAGTGASYTITAGDTITDTFGVTINSSGANSASLIVNGTWVHSGDSGVSTPTSGTTSISLGAAGTITNTGTITFAAGSSFAIATGGIFDNAGGTLNASADIGNFNTLMAAIAAAIGGIGDVEVDGTLAAALNLAGATGGNLTIIGALGVQDVNAGAANVIIDPDVIGAAIDGGNISGASVTVGLDAGVTELDSVAASAGNIAFKNTGILDVDGIVTATGDISADNTLTNIALGDNPLFDYVTAGGNIALANSGSTAIHGDVSAGGDVSIGAGGSGSTSDTDISGSVESIGGSITLGNTFATTGVLGDVKANGAGGTITINGLGIVAQTNIEADGTIELGSSDTAGITAEGDIKSASGNITITAKTASGGRNGDISLGDPMAGNEVSAGGSILIDNIGYTDIHGDVKAGTGVSIGAAGNTAASDTSIVGSVTTTSGNIILGNALSSTGAGGDVIAAAGSIAVDGDDISIGATGTAVIANGDITFGHDGGSGSTEVLGSVTSTAGDIGILGSGAHAMDDAVTAAGAIIATGDTTFYGAVMAGSDIMISGAVVFDGNVTGDIVTHYNGVATNSTVFGNHIGDLAIAAGDTHTIEVGSTFSGGGIANSGTLENKSTAPGITIGSGETFTNAAGAMFTNNGAVVVGGESAPGAGDAGVMAFDDQSTYAGTTGSVDNHGVIKADLDMVGMADLIADATLRAGSAFDIGNLNAVGSNVIGDSIDFSGAVIESGANVNLISVTPATPLELAAGKSVNAAGANLNLSSGTGIVLHDGSSLISAAAFAARAGSSMTVGAGVAAAIDAPAASFLGDAVLGGVRIEVNEGATLGITNAASVFFDEKTLLAFKATNAVNLGRIEAIGAAVTLGGDINVTFDGERRELIGQYLVDYGNGTLDTTLGNFVSSDYYLVYHDDKVWIAASTESVIDIMDDIFDGTGYEGLSPNKNSGGAMTDKVLADPGSDPGLVLDIGRIVTGFESMASDGDLDRAWIGFGQLFGEYGAYSSQLLREADDFFWDLASQRFYVTQNRRISANQGGYFGSNAVSPEDAYAVVRGDGGGFDVCKSVFTVWVEGFGGWARQRNRHNLHGYNYDSGGFNLGFDYTVGRFDFSLFGNYTKGKLRLRELATRYDADIMNLGLSAAYTHESGFYGRALFGYGRGWNDYDTNWVFGGTYHGKFDNYSISAGGEIGYIAQTGFMNIIPSVGLKYTHYNQKAWSESYFGAGPATPHWFGKQRLNTVDIPIGVRMNKIFCIGAMEIAPEIRVAWIYSAKRDGARIDMGYLGGSHTATMYGVNPGRNRVLIGGGVKARINRNWDANLDYDFTFRSKYRNHNVIASIGYSF